MKSIFSNDHVRKYTVGVNLWSPSFRIVERIHSGKWKVKHPGFGDYWASITARKMLRIHKWKCTL